MNTLEDQLRAEWQGTFRDASPTSRPDDPHAEYGDHPALTPIHIDHLRALLVNLTMTRYHAVAAQGLSEQQRSEVVELAVAARKIVADALQNATSSGH